MRGYGTLGTRRRALQAAASTLDQLNADETRPIDVFEAIGKLGVWLTFGRLKNLLGTFVPEGGGGVLITTERQPAVQRYTAAHEIGHLVLDNRLALDSEDDVFRPTGTERERLAQLFAAYFLMPPPLVHATATRYGIRRGQSVDGTQAYLVSRDMHVSYEAALRQLTELSLLTSHQRDSLLEVAPIDIKRELGHGIRPVNGYADVWPVDERSNGIKLDLTLEDEVVVALPESPATGFRWLDDSDLAARKQLVLRSPPAPFASPSRTPPNLAAEPAASTSRDLPPVAVPAAVSDTPLHRVNDEYAPGWSEVDPRKVRVIRRAIARGVIADQADAVIAQKRAERDVGAPAARAPGVGGTGRRWLHLRAEAIGTGNYLLHYASPYDPTSEPVATFRIETTVRLNPTSENRRRLLAVDLREESLPSGQGI
ncbi:MAG: ImmA/IrrE family metallo-endopeptidase [Candidatus Limnocylindrales bacterium]